MARRGRRSSGFSFQLNGGKELEKAFDELPKAMGKATLRRAIRKALGPVEDDAKRFFARHNQSGETQASIDISTKLDSSQRKKYRDGVTLYVGPTYPEGAAAHLIEWGTGPRYTKSGKYTGYVTPDPFMRPAWDMNRKKALITFRTEVWEELSKTAERLAKRAERGTLGSRTARQIGGG